MTEAEIEKIRIDYLKGLKYAEITQKYNITENKLKTLKRKYNWKRSKSNAQKGNKNARGNKGGHAPPGNKNAVTTGEYETLYEGLLDENELNILNNKFINERDMLIKDYNMLEIREARMLKRIQKLQSSGKDMTISSIKDKKKQAERETNTELELTTNIVQRIEEGITRIQESKRRHIESLKKFPNISPPKKEDTSNPFEGLTIEELRNIIDGNNK